MFYINLQKMEKIMKLLKKMFLISQILFYYLKMMRDLFLEDILQYFLKKIMIIIKIFSKQIKMPLFLMPGIANFFQLKTQVMPFD